MSISSLTNAAIGRRPDFPPFNAVPRGFAGIAQTLSPPVLTTAAPTPTPGGVAPGTPAAGAPAAGTSAPAATPVVTPGTTPAAGNELTNALQVIMAYIPTEVLTLYVAVLSALGQSPRIGQGLWITFWAFLAGTPVIVWLLYATKVQAAGKDLPWSPTRWPVWEMVAASLSFFAWAFALPASPWGQFASAGWYSPALAGVLVLMVSVMLGLVAPLCQRPLKP